MENFIWICHRHLEFSVFKTELIFPSQTAFPNVCLILVNDTIFLIIQVRKSETWDLPSTALLIILLCSLIKFFCIYLILLNVYHFFPPLHSSCLYLGSGPHHFLTGCPIVPLPFDSSSTLLWQPASLLRSKSAHAIPHGRYLWSPCSDSCLPLKLINYKLPSAPQTLATTTVLWTRWDNSALCHMLFPHTKMAFPLDFMAYSIQP